MKELIFEMYGKKRCVKHNIVQMRKEEVMFNKLILTHLRHDNSKFQDFLHVTIEQFVFLEDFVKEELLHTLSLALTVND